MTLLLLVFFVGHLSFQLDDLLARVNFLQLKQVSSSFLYLSSGYQPIVWDQYHRILGIIWGQYNPILGVILGQYNPIFGIMLGQYNPILGVILGQYNPIIGIMLGQYNPIFGVIFGQYNPIFGIMLGKYNPILGVVFLCLRRMAGPQQGECNAARLKVKYQTNKRGSAPAQKLTGGIEPPPLHTQYRTKNQQH